MNTALEGSSRRLIKGNASQMSQRSRCIPEDVKARKSPCSGRVFPSPPDAPGLLRAKIGHSKKQLCGFEVCSSLLQTDHFGFSNVAGLAKEHKRVHSRLDAKIDMRRWVRAGRRGNSLPPGFGNAPEERSTGDFSFPRRKLM